MCALNSFYQFFTSYSLFGKAILHLTEGFLGNFILIIIKTVSNKFAVYQSFVSLVTCFLLLSEVHWRPMHLLLEYIGSGYNRIVGQLNI